MLNKVGGILKKFGLDAFIFCIFAAIFIAWADPELGMDHGLFSLRAAAEWGVSVIFFLYGLRLNFEKLKEGLRNLRLHILIQVSTFIFFPLFVMFAMYFGYGDENKYVWLGFFFLAALPSTVSSSVVMVSIAGGNIPAAIFNASISSLAGVFITPIWMALYISDVSHGRDLSEVLLKLVIQVIVPIVIGIALNRRWGAWAQKRKGMLRIFDQTVIVLIVYTSFCESFFKKMFDSFGMGTLLFIGAASVTLFFCAYGSVFAICRILKFNREDTITALFCGSKKSLVHGSVMAKVIFADPATVGVALLPTMIYHALQLIVVSMIAQSMGRSKRVGDEALK